MKFNITDWQYHSSYNEEDGFQEWYQNVITDECLNWEEFCQLRSDNSLDTLV